MRNAALNARWDTATARRHWTKHLLHLRILRPINVINNNNNNNNNNNDGVSKRGDIHYETEPNLSIFAKEI